VKQEKMLVLRREEELLEQSDYLIKIVEEQTIELKTRDKMVEDMRANEI
jgi:hypothetical protein